jgi:hypothetical protein
MKLRLLAMTAATCLAIPLMASECSESSLSGSYSSSPAPSSCPLSYSYSGNWETYTDSAGNVIYSAGAGAAHPDPCARAKFLGLY